MLVDESLADLGYTAYLVDGQDNFTGQDVGLLSRLPVDEVGRTNERVPVGTTRQHVRRQQEPLGPARPRRHADDAHRRPLPRAPGRRRAEAAPRGAGRGHPPARRAGDRRRAAPSPSLGDFNDFDDATPDRAGSAPISDVLATIKAAGPGPEDDLRNVAAEVAADGPLHVVLGPEPERRDRRRRVLLARPHPPLPAPLRRAARPSTSSTSTTRATSPTTSPSWSRSTCPPSWARTEPASKRDVIRRRTYRLAPGGWGSPARSARRFRADAVRSGTHPAAGSFNRSHLPLAPSPLYDEDFPHAPPLRRPLDPRRSTATATRSKKPSRRTTIRS